MIPSNCSQKIVLLSRLSIAFWKCQIHENWSPHPILCCLFSPYCIIILLPLLSLALSMSLDYPTETERKLLRYFEERRMMDCKHVLFVHFLWLINIFLEISLVNCLMQIATWIARNLTKRSDILSPGKEISLLIKIWSHYSLKSELIDLITH